MTAGPELDEQVAKHVMGWTYSEWFFSWYPPGLSPIQNIHGHNVPAYSTDMAAAWDVFCQFTSRFIWYDDATDTWHCYVDSTRRVMKDCRYQATSEESAAEAICVAALKAVGKITTHPLDAWEA